MKTNDIQKLRILLREAICTCAIIGVEDILKEALALLPCETCGGTGYKSRGSGEHCPLLLCKGAYSTCRKCAYYIPPDSCPDCTISGGGI